MPKYSESSIYKLCCRDPSIVDIYIGSTTNFTRRKHQHKLCCNNTSFNAPVYEFMRSNGGFQNWKMIEIEKYKAHNKKHLETREQYWIDKQKPSLNGCKAYSETTREKIKTQHCDVCDVDYRCNWKEHQTSSKHYLLTIVHKNRI